ncbi:hypothetical protein Sste5346_003632 [Sporothrix stenoceras]|uniref:Uncharacterized protein n=1 Tax=Sporothrix stenoceras TaxID=5173 RepID=A0ABR3ZDQ8_9PEZI
MADEASRSASSTCRLVGEPMPDIAGIGILVGFSGQAFLSLCLALWVFFFSRHGRLDLRHEDGSDEHAIETKRLEMVQDILMIGNDIQVMMGMALMITVFSSYNHMDVYHFRLIYDIVSFVGVSIAAALVCFSFCTARKDKYKQRRIRRATGLPDENETAGQHKRQSLPQTVRGWIDSVRKVMPALHKLNKKNPIVKKFAMSARYRITYLFAASFLTLTILLNTKLGQWNDDKEPGACYNTAYTSTPGAHHPQADRVYVWVTCGWMLSVMMFAVFDGSSHRRYILLAAFAQFPLHFYMMVALRTANQGLLGIPTEDNDAASGDGGGDNSENDWDFGQTTAVLLFTVTVVEAISKGREFFQFERSVKKKRAAIDRRQLARENRDGDDGEDERDLVNFNAITNTTTESTTIKNGESSWLHPWKLQTPSQRHPSNASGGDSIAMINTGASSSAAAVNNSVSRGSGPYDVEAAEPTNPGRR